MHRARIIQANVFQIGASCGVVIEFTTDSPKEAGKLRDTMMIVMDAVMKLKGQGSNMQNDEVELDGMTLHEIFEQIAESYLQSE